MQLYIIQYVIYIFQLYIIQHLITCNWICDIAILTNEEIKLRNGRINELLYKYSDCINSTQHTKASDSFESYPLASGKKLNKGERQRRDLRSTIYFFTACAYLFHNEVCFVQNEALLSSLPALPLFFCFLAMLRRPLLINTKTDNKISRDILSLTFGSSFQFS